MESPPATLAEQEEASRTAAVLAQAAPPAVAPAAPNAATVVDAAEVPAEAASGTHLTSSSHALAAEPANGPAPAAQAASSPSDAPDSNGQDLHHAGADSDVVLTFRQHMWDSFELLWQKRVVPTRRQLEALVTCFRERAHLERQYARGIAQSVSKLEPLATEEEGGCGVPAALEAVIVTLRTRAEQSAALADELDQDVAATVEMMLRQHAEVSHRVLADGQRLSKQWQDALNSYEQCAARYAQSGLDAERAAGECGAAAPERPGLWRSLAERAVGGARRASFAKLEYHKALERRNAAWELRESGMGFVLSATQDMEEKRAQCFRDTMMKLAVYDTAWLRNVQYDLDSCVAAVEARGADADLQDFIQRNRTEASLPTRMLAKPFKDYLALATDVPKYTEARKAVEVFTAGTDRRVQALRPLIRQLLTGIPGPDASEEAVAELRLKLSSECAGVVASGYARPPQAQPQHVSPRPKAAAEGGAAGGAGVGAAGDTAEGAVCRAAFSRALHLELQAASGGEALEAAGPSEDHALRPLRPRRLPQPVMAAFGELVAAGLDGCDREGDAWNGRDLMLHAQVLQADGDSPDKPQSVLLKVYNHKLWSRVYFWEDLLIVGLAEAYVRHVHQSQQSGAGDDEATPQALMTPFLRRYVSFMVALGIKQQQAHGSLQQTLRKFTPFLGASAAEAYFLAMTEGHGGGTAPAPAGQ